MEIGYLIKQSKFQNEIIKVYVNLTYTFNQYNYEFTKLFKAHDFLPQHYNVLKIIKGRHPESVQPNEIIEVMLDKGRDLTRLIDKLESMKLVKRTENKENKRKIDISLTTKGLEVTLDLEKKVNHYLESINNLTDEEAMTLNKLLDKMRG